jgi:predicted ArsR family transcriptional regulator
MVMEPKNKAQVALELIKAGGATAESLMDALEVSKSGLASQLSYLNTRGLNIAEVDPTKAEFPIKNPDGTYRMGTLEEYQAKARGFGVTAAKTAEEAVAFAQKREDRASAALTTATTRLEANPGDDVLATVVEIRKLELELAGKKLHYVEKGDYQYESFSVE